MTKITKQQASNWGSLSQARKRPQPTPAITITRKMVDEALAKIEPPKRRQSRDVSSRAGESLRGFKTVHGNADGRRWPNLSV